MNGDRMTTLAQKLACVLLQRGFPVEGLAELFEVLAEVLQAAHADGVRFGANTVADTLVAAGMCAREQIAQAVARTLHAEGVDMSAIDADIQAGLSSDEVADRALRRYEATIVPPTVQGGDNPN